MKSLLFAQGTDTPPGCGPRTEVTQVLRKNGRLYTLVMRDKIVVEDPYLVMVKATGFAVQQGETYPGTPPARGIRDFLVKTNVVI